MPYAFNRSLEEATGEPLYSFENLFTGADLFFIHYD
jgi:hypothetical protein